MALPSDCSSTCSSSWSKSRCCDGGSVLRTSRTVVRSRGGCLGGLPDQQSDERSEARLDHFGLALRRTYATPRSTTHGRYPLHPSSAPGPARALWPCRGHELGGGRRLARPGGRGRVQRHRRRSRGLSRSGHGGGAARVGRLRVSGGAVLQQPAFPPQLGGERGKRHRRRRVIRSDVRLDRQLRRLVDPAGWRVSVLPARCRRVRVPARHQPGSAEQRGGCHARRHGARSPNRRRLAHPYGTAQPSAGVALRPGIEQHTRRGVHAAHGGRRVLATHAERGSLTLADARSSEDATVSYELSRRDFVATAGALAGAALLPAATGDRTSSPPADGTVVLFQGDSITDGGRDRGVTDNKVPDLEQRWADDTVALKPDVLSILVGVNDFWHKLGRGYTGTVQDYESQYAALLEETRRALPDVRLIVLEPFVLRCGAVDDRWFPEFDERRAAAQRVAQHARAAFVPLQRVFDDMARRAAPQYWAADGVHPTPAGHAVISEHWRRAAHL